MRAILVEQGGGPEVLGIRELPDPVPEYGEVLVRVRAAGVNRRDVWVRSGQFGIPAAGLVPGSDAAGDITAVGPGVVGWQVGDRVVVYPGSSCGRCEACRSGRTNCCPQFSPTNGAYAELMAVPVARLAAMPSGITFEEAATVGVPYLTAEEAWLRTGAQPGQVAVIWGATGGLGVAAVQLARLRGMRVLAVTRDEDKAERLQREGAPEALLWDGQHSLAAEVERRTGGLGADVVFDPLGAATFGQSVTMARRGGVVVTVGTTTGSRVELELREVFTKRLTILGAFLGAAGLLPRLLGLFSRGVLTPVTDRAYPLDEAAEAHRALEAGHVFGNVVLTP
ncbi:MAG: zinc-binding dehydrogenase [Thermaerobacter sp.]|nr:zinc-binding dehydrogenase [Thermaerobacter sp.]